jgi:glycosyltransferase 2 family protein
MKLAMSSSRAAIAQAVAAGWRNRNLRRIGGVLLLGLSLAFLVRALLSAGSSSVLAAIDAGAVAVIALSGALYGLLLMLLARAWSRAAAPASSLRQALAVYGTSVLPKYIPGSILQYGSRQLLGRRLGWDAALMAHASLLEIALHVVAALTIAMVVLGATGSAAGLGAYWPVLALALVVAGIVLIVVFRRLPVRPVIISVVYQLAFFAGLATLAALCGASYGIAAPLLPTVGGLFLLAWLVGFIMPLAPGGIGVREATGVALLSGLVGVPAALLVMASMRLVSLLGDIVIFVAGGACQRALRLTS